MSRRGPLIAGAVSVVVILLAVMLLILPKMAEVGKAKDQLTRAQNEEQNLQIQLQQLKETQQKAPEIEAELKQLDTAIPSTEDLPGLIRYVADAADSSAVTAMTLSPGSPSADASGKFSVVPVAITVDGSFFSLDEFLLRLESLPREMKVMSVQVSTGESAELALNMNAEVYTTDTSAGAGSEPGHQSGTTAAAPVAPPVATPATGA